MARGGRASAARVGGADRPRIGGRGAAQGRARRRDRGVATDRLGRIVATSANAAVDELWRTRDRPRSSPYLGWYRRLDGRPVWNARGGGGRLRSARTLQPPLLERSPGLASSPLGDLGVAGDRCQAGVTEGLGGEAGVAQALLEEGAQSVAELVRVEGRHPRVLGELVADMAGALGGEPVIRTAAGGGLEGDEEGRGAVIAGAQVGVDGAPGPLRDQGGALAVALAPQDKAVACPIGAVEAEHLADAGAGGEEQEKERPVALLREAGGGEGGDQALAGGVLEGLGEALGKAGQVDPGSQVLVDPLLAAAEAQEGTESDEAPPACSRSQGPAAGTRCPGGTGDCPLEGAQQVAVEGVDLEGARALAEGLEAAQLAGVGGDGGQAGVAVQLQPLQELGDRLGEG